MDVQFEKKRGDGGRRRRACGKRKEDVAILIDELKE